MNIFNTPYFGKSYLKITVSHWQFPLLVHVLLCSPFAEYVHLLFRREPTHYTLDSTLLHCPSTIQCLEFSLSQKNMPNLHWSCFPYPLPLTSSFDPSEVNEVSQSCPTLCDPMDGSLPGSMDSSLPGSAIHGIFQAKILEWAAISFSRGSSQPRDQTWVSCVGDRRFTVWATNPSTTSHFSFSWCSLKYLLLLISPSYSDPLQFSAPTLSCPQIRTVLPVSVPQAPSQV